MEKRKNDFRFDRLWNDCRPLDVLVADPSEYAVAIGLTKEKVTNFVHRKLETAHIEDKDDTSFNVHRYLQVSLLVTRISFAIVVEYMGLLYIYLGNDLDEYVETFGSLDQTVSVGSHFGKAKPIMQRLSKQIDHFISEYLRVNREVCGR